MSKPNQVKVGVSRETHKKLRAIAVTKRWDLSVVADELAGDYIAREGVDLSKADEWQPRRGGARPARRPRRQRVA